MQIRNAAPNRSELNVPVRRQRLVWDTEGRLRQRVRDLGDHIVSNGTEVPAEHTRNDTPWVAISKCALHAQALDSTRTRQ